MATELSYLVAEIDAKAVTGNGPGEITGLASTYGNVDLQGQVVEHHALNRTLNDIAARKAPLPLLDWHGDGLDRVIGSIVELKNTPLGLWFRARFSNDAQGQRARQLVKDGHLTGVSIGYSTVKAAARMIAGQLVTVLQEIRLHEISLTPVPANPLAQLESVKSVGAYGVDDDAELADLEAWASQETAAGLLEGAELAELESWASRQGAGFDGATSGGLRHVAEVLDLAESDVLAAELGAWLDSPEVVEYLERDRAADADERRRERWRRENERSMAMARVMAPPASGCGICQHCRIGERCVYDA